MDKERFSVPKPRGDTTELGDRELELILDGYDVFRVKPREKISYGRYSQMKDRALFANFLCMALELITREKPRSIDESHTLIDELYGLLERGHDQHKQQLDFLRQKLRQLATASLPQSLTT